MTFLDALGRRLLIGDGGTGTELLARAPDDLAGRDGLCERLNLERPDVVTEVHAAFLAAGCDLVRTNTFRALAPHLEGADATERARALALAGARLARRAADAASTADRPRFVAGSLGPPPAGVEPDDGLVAAYAATAGALVEGGCDLLLVETGTALDQVAAAAAGIGSALAAAGRDVPWGVLVTTDHRGRLPSGEDVLDVLRALLPRRPALVGVNCGEGPEALRTAALALGRHCPVPVAVMPSAGLPVAGRPRGETDLGPEPFAAATASLAGECGAALAGGCCGAGPAHLRALVDRLAARLAPRRRVRPLPSPGTDGGSAGVAR